MPENVTIIKSNGFRQGNLVMDPFCDLEPHKRVSQARDACCTRVINDKSVVVSVFQKKKAVHREGVHKERERITIHKISSLKIKWIFPGVNIHV